MNDEEKQLLKQAMSLILRALNDGAAESWELAHERQFAATLNKLKKIKKRGAIRLPTA